MASIVAVFDFDGVLLSVGHEGLLGGVWGEVSRGLGIFAMGEGGKER